MKGLKYISAFSLILILAASCIRNDMSLPRILARFMEFEVEGGVSTVIDPDARTVSVVVDEMVELEALKVVKCVLNEKAVFKDGDFPQVIDLVRPMDVMLSMYQDYDWTISAVQPVERYFRCTNQIGEAVIDADRRQVIVYISQSQRLQSVEVRQVKLERTGSSVLATTGLEVVDSQNGIVAEVVRDCEFPMVLDCNSPRTFDVSFQGQTYTWTLVAVPVEVAAELKGVDARCHYADVLAVFGGGDALIPVFEYKRADSEEWIQIAEDMVTVDGINLTARIEGLDTETDYMVRTVVDGEILPEKSFRTGAPVQLYNLSFDDWWSDEAVWYPYAQGHQPSVWDSANPGAAKFIGSSTVPTDDVVETYALEGKVKKAAMMVSKDATIAFAAGNLYTGSFGRVSGIGAILDWGVEFESKPLGLKGYYKYSPVAITNVRAPYENMLGQPDRCQIQIFLTDWDNRFTVNTTAGQFVDLQNDPAIIAYGKLESPDAVSDYKEFYIPLEYRDRTRTPRYIVISCCASYLGDYFTGGVNSTLFVDEFQLVYDEPLQDDPQTGSDTGSDTGSEEL